MVYKPTRQRCHGQFAKGNTEFSLPESSADGREERTIPPPRAGGADGLAVFDVRIDEFEESIGDYTACSLAEISETESRAFNESSLRSLILEARSISQWWIEGSINDKRFFELCREWDARIDSINSNETWRQFGLEVLALARRVQFDEWKRLHHTAEAIKEVSSRMLGGDDGQLIRHAICEGVRALHETAKSMDGTPTPKPTLGRIFGPSWNLG